MADAVSGPRRRARLGLARIVELETRKIAARLTDRGIELVLTPEATAFLAEAGHDPTFGARPLKRYLQQHVETPIARRILEGQVGEGQRIVLDAGDSGLAVRVEPTAAPSDA